MRVACASELAHITVGINSTQENCRNRREKGEQIGHRAERGDRFDSVKNLLGLYWFIPARTQITMLVMHPIEVFNRQDNAKSNKIHGKSISTYQH